MLNFLSNMRGQFLIALAVVSILSIFCAFVNAQTNEYMGIVYIDSSEFPVVRLLLAGLGGDDSDFGIGVLDCGEPVSGIAYSESSQLPIDLIFILDTTGSMRENLDIAKQKIANIASAFSRNNVNYSLSLITFGDEVNFANGVKIDPPDMRKNGKLDEAYPYRNSHYLFPVLIESYPTDRISVFRDWVDEVPKVDGNDSKENTLDAIAAALTLPLREISQKVIILITDVDYHRVGEDGDGNTLITTDVLTDVMMKNQFVCNVVLANYSVKESYKPFYTKTNGQYYALNNNLDTILDDIVRVLLSVHVIQYQVDFASILRFPVLRNVGVVKYNKATGSLISVAEKIYSPILDEE